jgi:uncharacterized membrane protein YkvA (DUF1232 family)
MTKFEEELEKSKSAARSIMQDANKTKDMLVSAIKKAEKHRNFLSQIKHELSTFFALVRDYLNGSYKEIPFATIIAVIAGISYFITPIDMIPDLIPAVGYIDDIAVISFIYSQIRSDIEQYEEWQDSQNNEE